MNKLLKLIKEKLGKFFIKAEAQNWRAQKWKWYYYINSFGDVDITQDIHSDIDDFRYKTENYFQFEKEANAYNMDIDIVTW